MVSAYTAEQQTRARLLSSSLRQLHRDTDLLGAADAVHQLRNAVLTAQSALALVERRIAQGREDEVDSLLDLAERRVREGRALVARTQFRRRHPTLKAA